MLDYGCWIFALVIDLSLSLYYLVQLWTMNNYHWYMKQHIVLPHNQSIIGFSWDVELPLHAHVVGEGNVMTPTWELERLHALYHPSIMSGTRWPTSCVRFHLDCFDKHFDRS
jgi:hypothetical protein